MACTTTTQAEVDQCLVQLRQGRESLARAPLFERIELIGQCIDSVYQSAQEWCQLGCQHKQTEGTAVGWAEEAFSGPVSTLRFLQLASATLREIQFRGSPALPGPTRFAHGRLRVPVFPTRHLFDSLAFMGLRAECWMQPGVESARIFGDSPERLQRKSSVNCRVMVVLGAGNVSAIPITDALTKIFFEDCVVLLKMNPVNAYLGPVFQSAFQSLIQRGWLRIVYGDAAIGGYAAGHAMVDAVHITGSTDSHEAIVWGSDPQVRAQQKQQRQPLLTKQITSELGNVTPWIVVPGSYTHRQLQAQAESVAASIFNNASFNCVATKMLITCQQWAQREQFLGMISDLLQRTPKRLAYYPGAVERFRQFSGHTEVGSADQLLPWTLLKDVRWDEQPILFQRESFCCVAGETTIQADSAEQFLERAVDFANDRMTGTLAANLTVPLTVSRHQSELLERALQRLRYGTIAVNQWNALGFAWMSLPWGGFPGATLDHVESGIGFVHNTYLLEKPEKSVIFGRLKLFPKPVWFSTHACPDRVAQHLLKLYWRPSLFRLPALFAAALRG